MAGLHAIPSLGWPWPVAAAGAPESAISPVAILVLCVVAGIGTVMLLPSRREAAWRKIGGAVLLAAGLIFAALVVRYTHDMLARNGQAGGMRAYFWVFSAIAVVAAVRVVTHPRPVYSALYFVLSVLATAGLFVLLAAEFMAVALVIIYAGAILVTYVFVIMLASHATSAGGGADREGPITGARQDGTRGGPLTEYDTVSREPLFASAVGFALMGVLMFVIFDKAGAGPLAVASDAPAPTTRPAPRPLAVPAAATVTPAGASAAAVTPATASAATRPAPAGAPILTTQPAAEPPPPGSAQALGEYLFRNQLVNLELAGLILTLGMVGAILIARRRVVVREPAGAGGVAAPPEVVTAPATPIDDNPHSIPVYGTDNPRAKQYPET